ncbi:MAG TPA: glycosyltransferase WbuB [Desulfotomaculum sp.]|nr:MAG: WblI protein [Desulfotomaculum sp. 46_80]HAG10966.1 glycosyltransferase WbuB [Desulfotomaculum sp.]
MRILIINHYAGSLDHGMEYRPFYFAREWAKMGHTVNIIAAEFSHLRQKNPEAQKDFQIEQIDGITYYWVKTGRYEGNGGKRAFTMIQFVSKLYRRAGKIAKDLKPDAVIASSTYPLDTYPARRIAKLAHARLIHEVHDMWPLTLVELGGISRYHPFVMLLRNAENAAYSKSDAVVSLLPNTMDYIVQHGMKAGNYHHIPNGIVLDDWTYTEDLPELHQKAINEIKLSGNFLVCYFGGHALSNALLAFVDSAKYLDSEKVCLLLVGQGLEKDNLIQRSKTNGSKNIVFLPPVSKKSLPKLLELTDALYIGAARSPLYRFGVSMNKLFDAMMAAKPVLYAVDAANNDVDNACCGITVEPDNAEAIAMGIKQMLKMDPGQLAQMGKNGRHSVIENNDYKILAGRFLQVLK